MKFPYLSRWRIFFSQGAQGPRPNLGFFFMVSLILVLVIAILMIKSEDDMQGDTFFILERSKVIGFVQKMSSVSRYIGYVVIELYTLECQLNFTVQEIKPD